MPQAEVKSSVLNTYCNPSSCDISIQSDCCYAHRNTIYSMLRLFISSHASIRELWWIITRKRVRILTSALRKLFYTLRTLVWAHKKNCSKKKALSFTISIFYFSKLILPKCNNNIIFTETNYTIWLVKWYIYIYFRKMKMNTILLG